MADFITFANVSKHYSSGETGTQALSCASFTIKGGSFCAIVGASGAGKTTILNLLGGIDVCDEGEIRAFGVNVTRLDERMRTKYRRVYVGFVFQFYNLVPNLTALENVELAAAVRKSSLNPEDALGAVGLAERVSHFPAQLSGGEQQRVAIARAFVKRPKLLLCDEPTGALDLATGTRILSLLRSVCAGSGATVVVITHNPDIAKMADQVIRVRDGRIDNVSYNPMPMTPEEVFG